MIMAMLDYQTSVSDQTKYYDEVSIELFTINAPSCVLMAQSVN